MSTILAVEDNPANLALLHAILARQGHRLLDARTLEEARRILGQERIELVLLDLRMPDGAGLDLAREIRGTAAGAALPIIVTSASVMPADRSAAQAVGCTRFLAKPIMPIDLMAAVHDALAPLGAQEDGKPA